MSELKKEGEKKGCKEGEEPNPNRKKGQRTCRKICKKNEYRDEKTFNCIKNTTQKNVNPNDLVKTISAPSQKSRTIRKNP